MTFASLPPLPDDPVGDVYRRLALDARADKLDLGIGVYRDSSGRSPLLASIEEAQRRLCAGQRTKAYTSPRGNLSYCHTMERLMLGAGHPALRDGRLFTVQTPGAGGALRAGAEMVRAMAPDATLWVSDPTWDQQRLIMEYSGLRVREYPYYDHRTNRLRFDEMLAALRDAPAGDVVLLHGCCHNPTGEDLSLNQWKAVAALMVSRGLVPFVDLVYQGLGNGVDEDAAGLRHMASVVPEMILASSSSKSFGIYRDRAGALTLLFDESGPAQANAERHVSRITRSLYFMPPDWGAALVVEVMTDPKLETLWREELDAMRKRIVKLRESFAEELIRVVDGTDFGFILRQKGMFTLLPLDRTAVRQLSDQYGIYVMPDGRINVAALDDGIIGRVVDAVAAVLAADRSRRAEGPGTPDLAA